MQIFVQVPSTITIDVESSDSIEGVLAKIQDRIGPPAGQPQLTYNGTILEPGRTLDDYNIQKLSVLVLTVLVVPPAPIPTTTKFLVSNLVTQVSTDNSISWLDTAASIGRGVSKYATSAKPLHTISGLWQERFATITSQLWFTNFAFSPNGSTLLGIEVQIDSIRASRVQDYVVQLVLNGQLVGDNIADPGVDNYKIYGSPTNLWNSPIQLIDTINVNFGVAIAFRSNVLTPHTDTAYIDNVAMRITYV